MKEERPIIALSGGFDPPRKDHITLILDASKIGDVVIILNSDAWCSRHRWNNKAESYLTIAIQETYNAG